VLTLLSQPGNAVDVTATSPDLAHELRARAPSLLFTRACVAGVTVPKPGPLDNPSVVVETAASVITDNEAPEWSTADLFSLCDKSVTAPTVKSQVRPRYPKDAKSNHIEGAARVLVVMGADGSVERAELLKNSNPRYGFGDEALKSARQWTFTPATRNGKPVRTAATLELKFSLRQ
jgi:TonB family protein